MRPGVVLPDHLKEYQKMVNRALGALNPYMTSPHTLRVCLLRLLMKEVPLDVAQDLTEEVFPLDGVPKVRVRVPTPRRVRPI